MANTRSKSTSPKATADEATPKAPRAKKATSKRAAAKKPAAKRSAAKKASPKRAAAKKPAAKRPAAKKAAPKRAAAKKASPKRVAAKKPAAKKASPKRAVAKKPAAKRAAPKRAAAKKPAAKRAAPKRAAAHARGPVGDGSLVSVLAELATVTDASTRAPATADELAKIERVVGTVPSELAALYGFAGNVAATFGAAAGPLQWLDVVEAARACKTARAHGLPAGLFPIASDEAGAHRLFDCDSGRIMDWDPDTRQATPLASTLATYLTKMVLPALRRARKHAR